ncbi:MAG: winged helix-turn-helix domain-containing protein [Acetobacteraceae bacterium]
MTAQPRGSYRFDQFALDLDRGVLLGSSGEELALRPKSFLMLQYFVENADRLIDRDELMRAVWPDVIVSDDSIAQCIGEIRRVLGGDGQRYLRTVQRRGYRFAGPVLRIAAPGEQEPIELPPEREISSLSATQAPDHPAIAVLPFQNMSGDPEQEYFADGMVEEIITALSRIRWLFVIARNSSFLYKGRAVDIRQVGRDLGVRYVLEGSVRRSAEVVRITAQLIDAQTGAHLWADRFDGPLQDVFALQDRIALAVAGVMEPTLQAAEATRTVARPTHDLTAYDLYLRAYSIALSSAARFGEALKLVEQAIARDPNYGLALSFASICYFRLVFDGRSNDPLVEGARSVELARRSLLVAPDDPTVMAHAANVLLYFGEDPDAMTDLVDRALILSPSYARGWYISGTIRVWTGKTEQGIEHVERALRLSAGVRVGWVVSVLGIAYFLTRRFEEAVPKFLLGITEDPTYPDPYRFLAACYAHMGRLEDAKAVIGRLRRITSVVVPRSDHLLVPEQRKLFLDGLRLATGTQG